MRACRSIIAVLATLVLAACKDERPPGVYDLSMAEAYKRLSAHALPDLVFTRQCGILIHVTPTGVGSQKVTWRVTSSGQQVVQFSAALTPVGEKQVKVEVQMPRAPNGGEVYDGSQSYVRPAFNQPLRPAVEEQVAAILEGRAFDIKRVPQGTDRPCLIQRGGLENGLRFRVDDRPGMDARQSAACAETRRLGGHC